MRDVSEIALRIIGLCEQSIGGSKNRFELSRTNILILDLIALQLVVLIVPFVTYGWGCLVWMIGASVVELSFETGVYSYVVNLAMLPLGTLLCIIPAVVLGMVFLFISYKLLMATLYMELCIMSLVWCMTYRVFCNTWFFKPSSSV